jgi:hypothetical protein
VRAKRPPDAKDERESRRRTRVSVQTGSAGLQKRAIGISRGYYIRHLPRVVNRIAIARYSSQRAEVVPRRSAKNPNIAMIHRPMEAGSGTDVTVAVPGFVLAIKFNSG